MRASVNEFVSWSAAIALLALVPAASGAQEEKAQQAGQAGEDRWVPSLAVISGITIQPQQASVEALDSMAMPLIPTTDEDDLAVSPYVGANLELMSPALPLPGRPRLFVGAEILPTFAASRDVAKVGDPSGLVIPDVPPLLPGEDVPRSGYTEESILGTGGVTSAEIDRLVFGAAVGVAFPFELRGRPLRLKPSFGWIRYRLDVEGSVLDAQCLPFLTPTSSSTACIDYDPAGPGVFPPPRDGFMREIVLGAQDSRNFNAIGGGLDIEMDTFRVGQFGVSLFLGGRFYRTLGKRTFDLSDSADFDDELGTDTVTASWSFEVDPWIYRAGLGLRFHWLGSRE